MYIEYGKKNVDGRTIVSIFDDTTQEKVGEYSNEAPDVKVSLKDLLMENGRVRDALLPGSVAHKPDLESYVTKEKARAFVERTEIIGVDGRVKKEMLPEGAMSGGGENVKKLIFEIPEPTKDLFDGFAIEGENLFAPYLAWKAYEGLKQGAMLFRYKDELYRVGEPLENVECKFYETRWESDQEPAHEYPLELQGVKQAFSLISCKNDVIIYAFIDEFYAKAISNMRTSLNTKGTAWIRSAVGLDGTDYKLWGAVDKREGCTNKPPTLPEDLVRTADIANVLRHDDVLDSESGKVLPELIPDPAVMWLKGKGRPDKPATTEGVILGDEADCTRYLSTDGAGVGAYEWEKRGGVWRVTRGDTGWRLIKRADLTQNPNSGMRIRRTADRVSIEFGGSEWDTIDLKPLKDIAHFKGEVPENVNEYTRIDYSRVRFYNIPEGWRGCSVALQHIFQEPSFKSQGTVVVGGQNNGPGQVLFAFSPDVPRDKSLVHLRIGIITFPSVDAWPDTLIGEPYQVCAI